MRQTIVLLVLLALLSSFTFADGQQTAQLTSTGSTTSVSEVGSGNSYFKLTWSVTGGTLSGCSVKLDSSVDNSSWSAGGAVAAQTCTSTGSSSVASVSPNYVRITLSTFTVASGTPTLTVTWFGYVNNPSGGGGSGTVTSVDLSAPADFSVSGNPVTAAGTLALSRSTETLTFSATPTFNGKGNELITLTGNVTSSTLSCGSCTVNQTIRFAITQDATGSRTFVWPSNVKNGVTITSTASVTTFQLFVWDGTNANAAGPGTDSAGAILTPATGADGYTAIADPSPCIAGTMWYSSSITPNGFKSCNGSSVAVQFATNLQTLAFFAVGALANGATATTQAASSNDTKVATNAYVDSAVLTAVNAAAGRDAVVAATAAVLPNTPTFTSVGGGIGSFFTSSTNSVLVVDSYTPVLNDRILVKNQATAANNGIYKVTQLGVAAVAPWIMTRALDYDQPSDMNNTLVPVGNNGTTNPRTSWLMTTTVTTVDTDAVTFAAFTPAGGNIVTASAPGVGLCHFAGSTQACTSSAANLASADVTGVLPVANGGTGNSIAHGTSALGTSAISSGACATVVTTSATGTATTNVIDWGFNGDPTGVTGYSPSANGMLTIIAYPSTNNVNFKVCNNTSSSITPGAITLNWAVL